MIKKLWEGYLFDGKHTPLIEVGQGTYIKLRGEGEGGTAVLKGILSEDTPACNIGLIRCSDLAKRKQLLTENVYMADISGFQYITVRSNGFSSVYGTIYGDVDEVSPVEYDELEYHAVIILSTYNQLIQIEKIEQ